MIKQFIENTALKGRFYNMQENFPKNFELLFLTINELKNYEDLKDFEFDKNEFYLQKDFKNRGIIFYRDGLEYWPIVNYKFLNRKRNLLLGLELAKRSILNESFFVYLSDDLEIS